MFDVNRAWNSQRVFCLVEFRASFLSGTRVGNGSKWITITRNFYDGRSFPSSMYADFFPSPLYRGIVSGSGENNSLNFERGKKIM